MAFPFTIKYSKRLNVKIHTSDTSKVLSYIGEFVRNKTADDVFIEGNELVFKINFFGMRSKANIMGPIEKGKFNLIDDGNGTVLTYEFFMYQLIVFVSIGSVFMGLVTLQPLFGVVCFAWVGGMNWLIALIRHRNMLDSIARGIENLIATESLVN